MSCSVKALIYIVSSGIFRIVGIITFCFFRELIVATEYRLHVRNTSTQYRHIPLESFSSSASCLLRATHLRAVVTIEADS